MNSAHLMGTATMGQHPPHSAAHEQAVIGSILYRPEDSQSAFTALKESDFFTPEARIVFRELFTMARAGAPIDLITLADHMEKSGTLHQIHGGIEFLQLIAKNAPIRDQLDYHIDKVQQQARLREIIGICSDVIQTAYEGRAVDSMLEHLHTHTTAARTYNHSDSVPVMEAEMLAPGRGVLQDVIDYCNVTAHTPRPEFAVQSALALFSVFLGRRFTTDQDNMTPLFFVNIARTGTGKEQGRRVILNCLREMGADDLIGGSAYQSEGGVFSLLAQKPSHITIIDEIGMYLSNTRFGRNAHKMGALSRLIEAWAIPSRMAPSSYSDHTKGTESGASKPCYSPCITMLGMTTPSTFYESLTMADMSSGFLNRIICYTYMGECEKPQIIEKREVPTRLVRWAHAINDRYQAANSLNGLPMPVSSETDPRLAVVPFSHEAHILCDELSDEQTSWTNALAKESAEMADMVTRFREISMRLSLIVQLCEDPDSQEISAQNLKWASDYVRLCITQTLKLLKRNLSGSEFERMKMEALSVIRGRGEEGVLVSHLPKTKPFSSVAKRARDEIIDDLTKARLIERRTSSGGKPGRPAMRYIAIEAE